jgi:pimeloyl-ACP methyl ester carboxylesterase
MARRVTELSTGLDVRDRLADVRAPCLVSCRTEGAWLAPDNGRYLAEQIPGAQLLELPGVHHDPWVGATDDPLAAGEEFVSAIGRDRLERRCPPSPNTV